MAWLHMETNKKNDYYGFWFVKHKFDAILLMLSSLINYPIDNDEIELIKLESSTTDDEQDVWYKHNFKGSNSTTIQIALDSDNRDIIHIRIKMENKQFEKLEALVLFQSLFKNFDIE
jgi:hypothetical protein